MTVSILKGPRGRRLALELLGLLARDSFEAGESRGWSLASSIMNAAHHLDPSPGSRYLVRGAEAGGEADAVAEPVRSPEGVAALIREFTAAPFVMRSLHETVLRDAFVASVDSARYWQEPDGTDALAATDEVRDALTPISDAIASGDSTSSDLASSRLASWWSEPVDLAGQFEVAWEGGASRFAQVSTTLTQTVAAWSEKIRSIERRAQSERSSDPTARFSSDWWSTPGFGFPVTTRVPPAWGSPVGLWLVEDGLGWSEADVRRVTVTRSPRVFEIAAASDWAELCTRFPIEVTAQKRHDWYRTTGRDGAWVMPDYTAVAEHYDAVHLTAAAYLTAAGDAIPVGDGAASVIAGWAPDETYWLTDAATAPRDPAGWTRSPGEWLPS
ncbi:hypothetical protein [Agreia sp. COWG]|uniref:hypothetical protein n=1 Tax=Agreia sp. COWG TaxID=2773266 RepID=UPI00192925CE|nr:hypothetical protein [Agreia sp. COWG]